MRQVLCTYNPKFTILLTYFKQESIILWTTDWKSSIGFDVRKSSLTLLRARTVSGLLRLLLLSLSSTSLGQALTKLETLVQSRWFPFRTN